MKRNPIYICRFGAPGRRQIRPGHWSWWITDGLTGPVIAEGTAVSESSALRQLDRALARCEFPPGDVRCGRPVLHPLSASEACLICAMLAAARVPVDIALSGTTVVVTPLAELTTEQEVRALRAICAETDAPVRWAGVAA